MSTQYPAKPSLPRCPHIDSLKKQARQLLNDYRSANPKAAQRIRASIPHLKAASDSAIFEADFTLQSAQCVIAREYGFSNWAALDEAVKVIRHADADLPHQIDAFMRKGQSIHVLVPSYLVEEIAQRLSAHCGQGQVLLVPENNLDPPAIWLSRMSTAPVVVSSPQTLGFLTMYERLNTPEGPWEFVELLAKVHAFVNEPLQNEQSPLVISGPDSENKGSRDLISMDLVDLYSLYGSMTDYRY